MLSVEPAHIFFNTVTICIGMYLIVRAIAVTVYVANKTRYVRTHPERYKLTFKQKGLFLFRIWYWKYVEFIHEMNVPK